MNKYFLLFIITIMVFFVPTQQIKAQEANIGELLPEDYQAINLPPLSVLFENARLSSTMKYYDARKEGEKSMLKIVENEWLKYFKVMGAYQYGIMGSNTSLSQEQQTTPISQLSNTKQSWYNVGVGVSVPIDDIFSRGHKIRKQKMDMKATEAEVDRWFDEQKIRIIEIYSHAVQYLAVIKIKSESMVIAVAQYRIAEADFMNGKIQPADLSARKGVQADAIIGYEETKTALNIALLQLEILSNTKIISK